MSMQSSQDVCRILMVEDEVADAKLVQHVLFEAGYNVNLRRVDTRDAFVHALETTPPDIILSDHGLPAFDGFAALKLAKKMVPKVPFIFVTRVFDEATLVRSLREGATDYVLKNGLSKLAPALVGAIQNGLQLSSWKRTDAISFSALQSLLEHFPNKNICIINIEEKIVAWTPGAERNEGIKSREAVGKDFSLLFSREEILCSKHKEVVEKVLRNGSFDEIRSSPEGPIKITYRSLVGVDGAIEGIVRIVEYPEATSGHKSEPSTETTFKNLVQATTEYGICMLDRDGRVVSWNAGVARLTGYDEFEIIGKNFSVFFVPHDVETGFPEKELEIARKTGAARDEGFCRRKDGSTFYSEWSITALYDEKHNVTGYSRVFHDISERKSREDAILREKQQLEQKVSERTAQLQETIKELEAFSYSVSHDLRAPLRHISGFVNILQESTGESLDEASLGYLKIIADSVKQMDLLIDNLLSFSRVGRAEMHKIHFNLDSVLHVAVREFELETSGRKVEWDFNSLGEVYGDPHLIRQVLTNLLSNALKYTGTRPVARIEVSAETKDGEKIVHVRDNGVGFDMKYSNKLFGVFQRLHPESDFEGTGIGLANVRRIVQRHGGRVWARGVVGEGAEFSFSLPQAER